MVASFIVDYFHISVLCIDRSITAGACEPGCRTGRLLRCSLAGTRRRANRQFRENFCSPKRQRGSGPLALCASQELDSLVTTGACTPHPASVGACAKRVAPLSKLNASGRKLSQDIWTFISGPGTKCHKTGMSGHNENLYHWSRVQRNVGADSLHLHNASEQNSSMKLIVLAAMLGVASRFDLRWLKILRSRKHKVNSRHHE